MLRLFIEIELIEKWFGLKIFYFRVYIYNLWGLVVNKYRINNFDRVSWKKIVLKYSYILRRMCIIFIVKLRISKVLGMLEKLFYFVGFL